MKFLKLTATALAVTTLAGCANLIRPLSDVQIKDQPKVTETIVKEIDKLPAPNGPKIAVAV